MKISPQRGCDWRVQLRYHRVIRAISRKRHSFCVNEWHVPLRDQASTAIRCGPNLVPQCAPISASPAVKTRSASQRVTDRDKPTVSVRGPSSSSSMRTADFRDSTMRALHGSSPVELRRMPPVPKNKSREFCSQLVLWMPMFRTSRPCRTSPLLITHCPASFHTSAGPPNGHS